MVAGGGGGQETSAAFRIGASGGPAGGLTAGDGYVSVQPSPLDSNTDSRRAYGASQISGG
jgi:hypothetical protein